MISRLFLATVIASALVPAAVAQDERPPRAPGTSPFQMPRAPDQASDVVGSRGRMLYENHCQRCHASVVHVRDQRRADSLKALEGWVRRWSQAEKLDWGEEEVVDVVEYLNHRYYKLPPPGETK